MDSRLFLQDTSTSDLLALGTVAVVGKILCKTNNVNCVAGANRARKAFKRKTVEGEVQSLQTGSQAMLANVPPAKTNGGAVVVGTKPAVVSTPATTTPKLTAEQLALLQKAQQAKSEQELMQLFQTNPGQALLMMMLKNPELLKTGVGLVGGLAQALPKIIQSAPQLITGLTSTIGDVLEVVPNLLTQVTGAIGDVGGGIFDALSNLWPGSSSSSTPSSSSSSGSSSGSNGGSFWDMFNFGSTPAQTTPTQTTPAQSGGNGASFYDTYLYPFFGETIFGFND